MTRRFACVFSGRYWETVERLRINQFYCAPTALRLLMRYDDSYATKYDLSSLKTLGSGTNRSRSVCNFHCDAVAVLERLLMLLNNYKTITLQSVTMQAGSQAGL
jgi:hypothetical protein